MGRGDVIVFGYGELGTSAVEALTKAGANIIGMVAPSNRTGQDVDCFTSFAEKEGIPFLRQPLRKAIAPFLEQLQTLNPDVILVWSYTMILPGSIIDIPSRGSVNVHGGLLPEYRGGHVMQWAIINGETETGVTLHYMDEGIDTGPIIGQGRFPITWQDDAISVRNNLQKTGKELIKKWWPKISAGTAPRIMQDESAAKYYRLRNSDDGQINWAESNSKIYNLIRALVYPWPGAFTFLRGKKIVVRKVMTAPCQDHKAPGIVKYIDDDRVGVATGNGDVIIQTIEVEGQHVECADMKKIFSVGDILGT